MKHSDIINLSHHEPLNHPRMSVNNRAAQFSPFAALNGYEELLEETSRLTDERKTLTEDEINKIQRTLSSLDLSMQPSISVIYFVKDKKKEGGCYLEYEGKLRAFDQIGGELIFASKKKIKIDDVISINELKAK